ncbi:MAG: nitrogenase component 1 [Lachnospiraceae bacterium]|nr:nitrogenase component 1 [Lachnospiraceae bacterium]
MSCLDERKILTREKRLSTVSHYNGTLETLKDELLGDEIRQRVRTFSQTTYDEIIYAVQALSKIEQAAVIVHGAAGCAASGIYFNQELPFQWYSTNLNERDTILGSDEKLRRTVIRVCEETGAKTIFIVGTPVVAINNDDINSLLPELEEELNIRVIFIYTDGFKTKTAVNGYDIVLHSLLRYIVEKTGASDRKTEDFINVVTLSENIETLDSVTKILEDLGISFLLLPQYASIDGIRLAGRAKATIVLNTEEGGYFARELEEVFGVSYIETDVPAGIRGTRKFINQVAKALELQERAAGYIEEQERVLQKYVKKNILAGRQVFLQTGTAWTERYIELVESLGGSVSGIAVPGVGQEDRSLLERLGTVKKTLPVTVAVGQPFEKANMLAKKEADFYLAVREDAVFAAGRGCIPVSLKRTACLGYEGVKQLISRLEQAEKGGELRRLAEEKEKAYYKASWLRKSSGWYVKQEVK